MNHNLTHSAQSGSTLVTTVIMIALSTSIVGSIVALSMNQSQAVRRNINKDRAFYLADAGLRCAIAHINEEGDPLINQETSQTFFSNPNGVHSGDWGFISSVTPVSGKTNHLVSVGRYNGVEQRVALLCVDLSTNMVISDALRAPFYVGSTAGTTLFYPEDFVIGPVHVQNDLEANGATLDRSEADQGDGGFGIEGDSRLGDGETWVEAGNPPVFSGPSTQEEFDAHQAWADAREDNLNVNGKWDPGEAFLDEGNGVWDPGEAFTDQPNGKWDPGEAFTDQPNGTWDSGESFTDLPVPSNNKRDSDEPRYKNDTTANRNKAENDVVTIEPYTGTARKYKSGSWYWYADNPKPGNGNYDLGEPFVDQGNGEYDLGEPFVDQGNGVYDLGEPFVDQGNGVYNLGEEFIDDRNAVYDRGVTAKGTITGLAGTAIEGENPSTGGDRGMYPPDLSSMNFHLPRDGSGPIGAASGWGHDIKIDAAAFGGAGTAKKITNKSNPAHIFVMNPPVSGNSVNGIGDRTHKQLTYPTTKDNKGNYIYGNLAGKQIVNDFFLEDPTHTATYTDGGRNSQAITKNDSSKTEPMYIDVQDNGNNKVYYIDGNLHIHHPQAYALQFAKVGTKVTFVVKGNITISDEFYYNGKYGSRETLGDKGGTGTTDINYSQMNSSVVKDAKDSLTLIAMKDHSVDDILGTGSTGNINIGDPMAGTGGAIHAYLFAENNIQDNNALNPKDQPSISVYGCMAAGNQIDINREDTVNGKRTRLDVTANPNVHWIPGAPPPSKSDVLTIPPKSSDWQILTGTWAGQSPVAIPDSGLTAKLCDDEP